MIDLLICCLALLPFLTADIRRQSWDHGAGASEGHTGPSIYRVAISTERQRRDKDAAAS